MNRKEVIERYKSLLNYRYSHGMEYDALPDGVVKDATTDLMESVLRELTNANPDPETGLVLCGCGGTPEIVTYDGIYHYVHCTRCGIKSEPVFMNSSTKWNVAMGYKEGAHE